MKTITVINQKGGVGKSTTALAVGAGLTLHGYAVLYIDLDAQGNLSFVLGADTTGYNALGVLQRPETVNVEVRHLGEAGDIIASSPALAVAVSAVLALVYLAGIDGFGSQLRQKFFPVFIGVRHHAYTLFLRSFSIIETFED